MFVDLGNLVFVQGEILNSIEGNLNDTKDYVGKAKENLDQAKDLQQSYRKKMCCLIIFIVLVVLFGFGGYKIFI